MCDLRHHLGVGHSIGGKRIRDEADARTRLQIPASTIESLRPILSPRAPTSFLERHENFNKLESIATYNWQLFRRENDNHGMRELSPSYYCIATRTI